MKSTYVGPNYTLISFIAPPLQPPSLLPRHFQEIALSWKFPLKPFLMKPNTWIYVVCVGGTRAIEEGVIRGSIEKWNVAKLHGFHITIFRWFVSIVFVSLWFQSRWTQCRAGKCNTRGNPIWRNCWVKSWTYGATLSRNLCVFGWATWMKPT